MQLTGESIMNRLRPMPRGVPSDYLQLVSNGRIPRVLELALENGAIIIDPFPEKRELAQRLGPITLDFSLGNEIEVPRIPLELCTIDGREVIRKSIYDERRDKEHRQVENMMGIRPGASPTRMRLRLTDAQTYELTSNTILVGYTREVLCLPCDLAAHVNGKSRHARRGFKNHMTAPRFDPGFIGHAALEMSTEDAGEGICIYPGMIIAAFEFSELDKAAATPYYRKPNAKYLGQS